MGQLFRLAKYSRRFLLDRQYRNKVIGIIQRQIEGERQAEATIDADEGKYNWLSGKSMYLVGGCELTFIKDLMNGQGMHCYHTFDHGRVSDPLADVQDADCPLWKFGADYILLSQVQLFRRLVGRLQRDGWTYERAMQENDLDEMISNYDLSIQRIRRENGNPIFIYSYPLEYKPALGIHEYRSLIKSLSLVELIRTYELRLYQLAKEHKQVYVLDNNQALELTGKAGCIELENADGVYEHLTRKGAKTVAKSLLYQLSALAPSVRRVKCAVFDLDGTLWSGVLREDGPQGVVVRHQMLTVMHHLAARGIVLAISSKNDEVELEHLPGLIGKALLDRIVVKKLNWQPKSLNLREIAHELNIGLDTVAIFDDNPVERAEIETNTPEVLVFSETEIIASLKHPAFEPLGEVTSEASSRVRKYKEQAERQALEKEYKEGAYEDFLLKCQLELTLRAPLAGEISRVYELIQRTNQLNATMRRTTISDLQECFNKLDRYAFQIALLKDRFGDYGIIGVLIAEKGARHWTITELAFSCRAMGKHVENACLNYLAQTATQAKTEKLLIHFIKTTRNAQMYRILTEVGFRPANDMADAEEVDLFLSLPPQNLIYPEWFNVSLI